MQQEVEPKNWKFQKVDFKNGNTLNYSTMDNKIILSMIQLID